MMSESVWRLRTDRAVFDPGDWLGTLYRLFAFSFCFFLFSSHLFIVWCAARELLNLSPCVRVYVCVHVCGCAARQERTCPHMVGPRYGHFLICLSSDQRLAPTMSPVFHHRKMSLPALNKSHEQIGVTSGQESTTQCVYYSCTLNLEYLSFSAEWLENTSLLRVNWLSPTFTLNWRLSTFVHYWHNCNWLQWNDKKKFFVI